MLLNGLNEANLSNLTSLWKKYGAIRIEDSAQPSLFANSHWPHRCWLDWAELSAEDMVQILATPANHNEWLRKVPEAAIIPLLPLLISAENEGAKLLQLQLENLLLEKKWTCTFEQTGMYLQLHDRPAYSHSKRSGFQLNVVRSLEDLEKWVDIASEAFAYRINHKVIENLLNDKDIQVLIGHMDGQAVSTALLYQTGDIIGVHQVGVKQTYQGKGIARSLMVEIIENCDLLQSKTIVLQASVAGKPLYDSLGFRELFFIKNYQKL